jgi:hypothetical protein
LPGGCIAPNVIILTKTRPCCQKRVYIVAVARPPGALFVFVFMLSAKVTPLAHQLYSHYPPFDYQTQAICLQLFVYSWSPVM